MLCLQQSEVIVIFVHFLTRPVFPSVLLGPGSLRHRPETPQYSLHCPLLPGVYTQDHGFWFSGECQTEEESHLALLIFRNSSIFSQMTSSSFFLFFFLLQNYFRDTWNIFDFITVLGSITEIIVDLQVSSCQDTIHFHNVVTLNENDTNSQLQKQSFSLSKFPGVLRSLPPDTTLVIL